MKQHTSLNIVDDSLASAIVEALQSDACLKELYALLAKIDSNAIPMTIQVSQTGVKAIYSEEVQRLIDFVHQEIELRHQQILEHYTKQKGTK